MDIEHNRTRTVRVGTGRGAALKGILLLMRMWGQVGEQIEVETEAETEDLKETWSLCAGGPSSYVRAFLDARSTMS